MSGPRVLPDALARRAREFVASGLRPVPARQAATVVLLRDGPTGMEAYVHVRHAGMAFAGGMLAFPGGGVDPVDQLDGSDVPGAWSGRLATDVASARAFVRAAIRETTEETGVALRPDELAPWAHWVTPRFEPRRYDTWFFVARVPAGQEPADVSGEASRVAWVRPAEAVERAAEDGWTMLPPTRAVLEELGRYASTGVVLAAAADRVIETVLPGWVDDGEHVLALLPGDPGYPGDDPGEPR